MYTENEKIVPVEMSKQMQQAFLDYSMSVIVARALPDVRDGLKPVHRRILYTMGENNLVYENPHRKCADTVGKVLGAYHPHGDASVYDALVRLAQKFSLRYPLIDGHGNFGTVDGDPPAAYRYTEARMSKICEAMLRDIDKETVDFAPNYDDTTTEPTVLPSRLPNLLLNGSTGIAVGMATNIPPHNLCELIDGIDFLMENPDCSVFDLMQFITGPDFPTGGIIMGRSGIRAAYATGRGKIILRGRAVIEEHGNDRFRIAISEIPYMVNKARLIESIADLVKDKRVEGISDLRDESDKSGMRIVVELKRDANPQVILNQLYRFTQLQDTFGVIMLALVNGEPKEMDLKTMLVHYVDFQCSVIRRRTEYDLKKARERAHIVDGLLMVYDFMDEVIKILRASPNIPEGRQALIDRFGISEIQAGAIVAMRLGQLTGLEKQKLADEKEELRARIADFEDILANQKHVFRIIREDLAELREKFGDERRTEIAAVSGEVDIEDLIPVESCVLTLTHMGYVKRQPADTYKSQKRGGRGISGLARRDEDFVEELFVCSSHDCLLFMTSMGRVYKLKAYEITAGSRASRGVNIVNLLPLLPGEKVTSMIRVPEFTETDYLVMVTRSGIIKRTSLSLFANIRKTGVYCITLDEGDELACVRLTDGDCDLIIATRSGMAIRFNENDARPLGRTARGVKAIALSEDDEVVGMSTVRDDAKLLTVTEDGKGRLTQVSEYRRQYRGGKGVTNYHPGKGRAVAGVKIVDENDDVILISQAGIIIRTHVEEIATQSRYGGGVNVMRVGEGDRVVTVARAEREETDDADAEQTDETPGGQAVPTAEKASLDEFIDDIAKQTAELDAQEQQEREEE